ncbi:MAG: heme exporter protein CcmB [Gammaproteobacteria bacterium]|nr:heme exporter protein CcmB [Gammaproteobacteria bacterium]
MNVLAAARSIINRDLLMAWRRRGDLLNPVLFFLMVALVFPLSVNPEPDFMRGLAPGILWVAALLASLIGLNGLFIPDFEDGSLEQQAMSPVPLAWIAFWRVVTHWLITGLPLLLMTPVLAVPLGFPLDALPALLALLLPGTVVFSVLGAIGAALTVSLRSSGMLMPVLVLPLTVPVLVFGARGAQLAMLGEWPAGPFSMLLFLMVLGLATAPLAIAGGLRISLD